MTTTRKKLIEVALPLEAINVASAREKSIRHGHPSTLHLWWAWLKIAVSLFGAVATYIFWREFIGQAVATSGQPNVATTALSTGIIMSLMGLFLAVLYPIAVLIVMHLRSVRNYLSSVT